MDVKMFDYQEVGTMMSRFGLIYYTYAPCTESWLDNNRTGTRQPNDCISSMNAYNSNIIENVNARLGGDIA